MIRNIWKKMRKLGAGIALLSAEMLVVLVIATAMIVILVLITRQVFVLRRTDFDTAVFDAVGLLVSDRNNAIIKAFTFLGSHSFLIPANLALIAFALIKKHKWYSIKLPAIALSSVGLMFILKRLFNRERPDVPLLYEAEGLSFPSGHALMSVTFYGLLIYVTYTSQLQKGWKWTLISLLALLILFIGFTRVYLRVHYATDVIAGLCTGFIWLIVALTVLNKMERYSRRNLNEAVETGKTASA